MLDSTEGWRILAAARALQPAIRAAADRIERGRTLPSDVVDGLRDAGEDLSLDQRAHYRLAITHAHRAAVEAVDTVFQGAGTTPAVRLPSVLERCFRDVHVAAQHAIASPHTYVETGAMLLGAVPNDPTY